MQLPVLSTPASSFHILAQTAVDVVVVLADRSQKKASLRPPLPPLYFPLHSAVGCTILGAFSTSQRHSGIRAAGSTRST